MKDLISIRHKGGKKLKDSNFIAALKKLDLEKSQVNFKYDPFCHKVLSRLDFKSDVPHWLIVVKVLIKSLLK